MKKLLLLSALVCFPAIGTIGCGSGENKIIEAEPEPSMTSDQQAEYERQMREGSSSRPGN